MLEKLGLRWHFRVGDDTKLRLRSRMSGYGVTATRRRFRTEPFGLRVAVERPWIKPATVETGRGVLSANNGLLAVLFST